MTRFFLLISAIFLLSSCAADTLVRGQNSQLFFSPAFNYEAGNTVALLPFANSGRMGLNHLVTERFAANLLWAGFRVVDKAELERAAAKAGITLKEIPTRAQQVELAKSLGVRIVIAGSCIYRQGTSAEDEGAISMLSARFLDAATGETLIYATTQPDGVMPVTRSLAAAVRNSLLNDLFLKGNSSYEKKNYQDAIAHYNALITLEGSLVESYRNRGAAWSKAGDNKKALADYNKAISLFESANPLLPQPSRFVPQFTWQPEKAELLINRGIIMVKSGSPEAAVLDFNKALAAGGNRAVIHANLGYARFRMKEFKNAIIEYDKAISADSERAEIYYQRGLVFEEVNLRESINDFSRAIRLDSRFAPALAARARVNLRLGYKDDAIRDYTLAVELEPENSEYLTGRGAARFQAGDKDMAINDYSKAIKANPAHYDAYLGRGVSYAAKGDNVNAGKDFDKVIQSGTAASGAVYLEKGILKEKQGSYRDAIVNFTKAIETSGKDAAGYSNRGRAFERMANYQGSVLDFSRSLELKADNPQDLFNRGYSRVQSGVYRQAIDDFSRAASLDPGYAPIFSNRGYAYQKTGNYSQAISDYSRALTLKPEKSESSYRRRYPEANLNQVVEEYHPFFIYYNRGLSYLASTDYRPAIADFTKAIELAPRSAEAFARRAMANQQIAEMERALADYNRAIELDSGLADAYFGRGSWNEQSGKFGEAISDYTKALDIMPDFDQAYFSRGLLRIQMRSEELGIQDIKAAARMNLRQAKDYLMTRGADW